MTERQGALVEGGAGGIEFPDRFVVERIIGRGGSGVVFAAWDRRLDRRVAVKVLPAEAEHERVPTQLEEARVLAALSHPHLVAVYDTFLSRVQGRPGNAFLVLEHVDGPDLAQYLRTARLDLGQVVRIAIQLCSALAYVHDRGFIHRDLKPSNVLLRLDTDGDMEAKLSDFGTALVLQGAEEHGEFTIGTAAYLSPEQAEGTPLTVASDVYALGLVLLEAATGQVAFPGTVVESALARLDADPVVPADLPEGLRGVLVEMTHRDPERRIDLRAARRRLQDLTLAAPGTAPADPGVRGDAPAHRVDGPSGGAGAQTGPGAGAESTAQFFLPQEQELTRLLELAVIVLSGTGAALLEPDGPRLRHRAELGLLELATSPVRRRLQEDPRSFSRPGVHLIGGERFAVAPVGEASGRQLVVRLAPDGPDAVAAQQPVLQGFADVLAAALELRDSFRRALFAR